MVRMMRRRRIMIMMNKMMIIEEEDYHHLATSLGISTASCSVGFNPNMHIAWTVFLSLDILLTSVDR